MWFWYGRDPNIRGSCGLRTSSDEKQQDKSSQRMKYTYEDQRGGKFLGIHKLLSKIHQEFQLYSKTTQQVKRKKEVEVDKRTQRKDNKSTSTFPSENGW